jgi:hypothetical protein
MEDNDSASSDNEEEESGNEGTNSPLLKRALKVQLTLQMMQ